MNALNHRHEVPEHAPPTRWFGSSATAQAGFESLSQASPEGPLSFFRRICDSRNIWGATTMTQYVLIDHL